jgi:hypothetical protein
MTTAEKTEDVWIRDPDFIGAEAALRRASVRARSEALKTCGYVVMWRDGKIVEEPVHEMSDVEIIIHSSRLPILTD